MAEGGQIMTTFNCLNPKASQTPSIGKRLVTVLVVGFLLIAAIGFAIWGQHLNTPSSSARAPAPVAGNVGSEEVAPDPEELQALAAEAAAPAARASAPAARAPITEVVDEDDTTLVATSDKDRLFAFKRGDTASERFGKDAKKFCEYNQIADCDRVKAGVKYKLPEGLVPKEVKSTKREVKAQRPKTERKATTLTQRAVREQSCIRLGAQPFNPEHKLERTLQGIDALTTLTPAQKEIAKAKVKAAEKATEKELVGQQIFKEMLYQNKAGKLIHVYDKPICDPNQGGEPEVMDTYDLGDGVQLSIPRRCGNPSVFIRHPPRPEPEPKPQPEPEPKPQPEPEPKPQPEPEPKPQPEPAPVPPQKSSCIRPEGVGGQEFEPPQDGVQTRATYVAADIRCIIYDGEDYQVSIGVGGTHVDWDGKDGQGGNYGGQLFLAGLSTKVVSHNNGWDAALRFPAFGKFESAYRNAAYGNDRNFKLGGLTLSVNDFRRKLAGHEWWYETQYNFSWAKALGGSRVGETIFGRPTGNTSGLGLDYYANATVRQYITRLSENSELYGQIGFNIEEPVASSMSARVGAAFYERCVGAGFGLDQKLKPKPRGKPLKAFGYWVDPFQCGEAYRIHVRGKQIVREAKSQGINFAPDSIGPAPSDD